MSDVLDEDQVRNELRSGAIDLVRLGQVAVGPGPDEPFVLLDAAGDVVEPVSRWVRYLAVADHSPRTIRSYCYAVLTWFRVLWHLNIGWDRATQAETATLVGWLRMAPNPQRRRRPSAIGAAVNMKTGKPNLGDGYGSATINLTLAAVRGFYDFHAHWAHGPEVNPIPESAARRRALSHRSPLEPRAAYRRGAYRRRGQLAAPRSIPQSMWDLFFAQLVSDRDRALIACFVSSGARAAELLGACVEDVDWAGQRMSVVSKGSRERRMVPLSPDALTWLGRYLRARGGPAAGPLWTTMRGDPRPLTYGAARRVVQRVNDALDTNWTLHDLRHTAATRMVTGGVLTLPEVQVLLGHADLRTTTRYTMPRIDEVIAKMADYWAQPPPPPRRFAPGYADEDIAVLFGARADE